LILIKFFGNEPHHLRFILLNIKDRHNFPKEIQNWHIRSARDSMYNPVPALDLRGVWITKPLCRHSQPAVSAYLCDEPDSSGLLWKYGASEAEPLSIRASIRAFSGTRK
jgi:hypothetical protein